MVNRSRSSPKGRDFNFVDGLGVLCVNAGIYRYPGGFKAMIWPNACKDDSTAFAFLFNRAYRCA
jgi:hypothetical protein